MSNNLQNADELISYSTNIKNTKLERVPFATVIEQIKTGSNGLRSTIDTLRSLPEDGKRAFKEKHLPYFSMGLFKGDHRKNNNLETIQFIVLDFDHLGNQVQQARMDLIQDKRVYCLFTSPSGDGLKVACKLDKPVDDPGSFTLLYKHLAEEFSKEHNLQYDDSTTDAARSCFLSYDPDIHVNLEAELLSTQVSVEPIDEDHSTSGGIVELMEGVPKGNRTHSVVRLASLLKERGLNEVFTIAFLRIWNKQNQDPLPDDKLTYTVTDIYRRYQAPGERLRNFHSSGKDIFQFGITKENGLTCEEKFFMEKITKEKFEILINATEADKDRHFEYLVKSKHIAHIAYVAHFGDMNTEESYYDVSTDEGVVQVRYRAIAERLQDNQFIEQYLESTFGKYKDFIKQYLAMYCYTNFVKLPTLVFTGKRGSGKNTFAEMLGNIFPSISTVWRGNESTFNPEVEKKLLVADETVSDNPDQYKTLKKYSGSIYHLANVKYVNPYKVRNNINMVILSNEKRPIFVARAERPTNEKNNQFFMFEFKQFNGEIDADYGKKLAERLGHYIRTELKDVYSKINTQGYRYAIEVPITPEEKALYDNNVTEIEAVAEHYIMKMEYRYNDLMEDDFVTFVDNGYLPSSFFDNYDIAANAGKTNVIKKLVDMGYIVSMQTERKTFKGKRSYAYQMSQRLRNRLRDSSMDRCERQDRLFNLFSLPMCPRSAQG